MVSVPYEALSAYCVLTHVGRHVDCAGNMWSDYSPCTCTNEGKVYYDVDSSRKGVCWVV